ncbi:hypothetical protein Holit_01542 [Hollandina sp. SP2]
MLLKFFHKAYRWIEGCCWNFGRFKHSMGANFFIQIELIGSFLYKTFANKSKQRPPVNSTNIEHSLRYLLRV